jgi:PIN domain nuclease of toxin-antitoxin system
MERCLLDTMTVLWMALRPDLLGKKALGKLADPDLDLAFSVVSLWEIGIKMSGKGYDGFELPEDWDFTLPKRLEEQGITRLPVSPQNCRIIQDGCTTDFFLARQILNDASFFVAKYMETHIL